MFDTFCRTGIATALHKKCRYTNQSANGAEYDSQGQARSASPLVRDNCKLTRPERPKYDKVLRPFRLHGLFICYPGATRFALAPGYCISRRWRSGPLLCKADATSVFPGNSSDGWHFESGVVDLHVGLNRLKDNFRFFRPAFNIGLDRKRHEPAGYLLVVS